ncbi:PREDICTED: cell division cycle-associated protein 2 [Buceros rhinoceros silvestris]|uniref:cell division cycle-associated protein 2 n=1 Tax=Buceros rhinoceros silvestris TaxID=175836 RepID=UPI000528B36B|nr:PREDICTED: cell division cycle-associated protein 2 [Buceros rhinoceros silvestris]
MHRRSKNINAPLEGKENESGYTEDKEEAPFAGRSKDQKIRRMSKSKVVKAARKESLSGGNQAHLQGCTPKCPEGLPRELQHCKENLVCSLFDECSFDQQAGNVAGEQTLPLSCKDNVLGSGPVSSGRECYLTPTRDKAEENPGGGASGKQTPVDFATGTVAEFWMTPERLNELSMGKAGMTPTSLKCRRGATVGIRGTPEHESLMQFLAQERSNREKEAFTQQVSPFEHVSNRSLKDRRDASQTSCPSVHEAEEETGFSGRSRVDGASQEAGSYLRSDHISEGTGSDVVSDLSRKKVSFAEEASLQIFDKNKPPSTPLGLGNAPLGEHTQSGSHPPSILKKTPVRQRMDCRKEYSNDAVDGGGRESLAVSSCASQAEETDRPGSEKPEEKKVISGEVLSPEVLHRTSPAHTPLRRGARPVCHPGPQSNSPLAQPGLAEEPLPQPLWECSDECGETLQELKKGPVSAQGLLPIENANAETARSDMVQTRSTKRKRSTISERTDFSISRATNPKSAKDTKNPKENKFQRQKNVTASAAKKKQKIKRSSCGKGRKKKVKKSSHWGRISKNPLLSPIPEIPEFLSFDSTQNSPKTNEFLSGNTKPSSDCSDVPQKPVARRTRRKSICAVYTCASSEDLGMVEAGSSCGTVLEVSCGDPKSAADVDHKFSNAVSDAESAFDPSDYFQQGKETACMREAKESGSLRENKNLDGNSLNKVECLTGLELQEQEDTSVQEGAQRTWSPQKDSIRDSTARRRRRSSSANSVETWGITGNSLPDSSMLEEVFSPQLLEPFRRRSSNSGEKMVRRSMRLHKDTEHEGLAWFPVPSESHEKPPLPTPACKSRTMLGESENVHWRGKNLIQFSALGKENAGSVHPADGPCKRCSRRRSCVSTAQETTRSQTPKRRNSVCRKDRSNRKLCEEVAIPLEGNCDVNEVSATSDVLK